MVDQHCLCPGVRTAEAVRDDAVARALRELDGELRAPERAAVASLADRLTARLAVFCAAPCPRHGAGERVPGLDAPTPD